MANDLVPSTARAHGRPALAWMALNPHHWTTDGAIGAAGDDPEAEIDRSIAVLQTELMAVPKDPKPRAEWSAAMDERLRRLAVKISPAMSVDAGDAWRKVMTEALADLPAFVALTAAKRALHRPMRYMNEIEFVIREIAAEIDTARRDALARLRAFRDRIANAGEPVLPAPKPERMTPEQVDEANAMFRRLRIKTRYRPDGSSYLLESGDDDPAPAADESEQQAAA